MMASLRRLAASSVVATSLIIASRALAEDGQPAPQAGAAAAAPTQAAAPAAAAPAPSPEAATPTQAPAAVAPAAAVVQPAPSPEARDAATPTPAPATAAPAAGAQHGEVVPAAAVASPAPPPAVESAPKAAEPAPAAASPAPPSLASLPPAADPLDTAWYQPLKGRIADEELPWNSSILGAFDPWTNAKITVLGFRDPVAVDFEKGNGMVSFTAPDGTSGTKQYPSVKVSGDFVGGRLEWGDWSASYGTGTTTMKIGNELGTGGTVTGPAWAVTVATGFGAWALLDFESKDVRVGISWPEFYLRYVSFTAPYASLSAGIDRAEFMSAGLGVSLVGLRVTVGDVLFAEIRAGTADATVLYSQVKYAPASPSESGQTDQAFWFAFSKQPSWSPTLRIGIAL